MARTCSVAAAERPGGGVDRPGASWLLSRGLLGRPHSSTVRNEQSARIRVQVIWLAKKTRTEHEPHRPRPPPATAAPIALLRRDPVRRLLNTFTGPRSSVLSPRARGRGRRPRPDQPCSATSSDPSGTASSSTSASPPRHVACATATFPSATGNGHLAGGVGLRRSTATAHPSLNLARLTWYGGDGMRAGRHSSGPHSLRPILDKR